MRIVTCSGLIHQFPDFRRPMDFQELANPFQGFGKFVTTPILVCFGFAYPTIAYLLERLADLLSCRLHNGALKVYQRLRAITRGHLLVPDDIEKLRAMLGHGFHAVRDLQILELEIERDRRSGVSGRGLCRRWSRSRRLLLQRFVWRHRIFPS